MAQLYVERGAQVLATDVHDGPLDAEQPGGYRRLDVRSDADWASAITYVEQEWGGLDVLVNNAGVATGGRIDHVPTAEWEWAVSINLLGVARGCVAATPVLKRQRSGHLVNIASMAGLVFAPSMSAYAATKAGVVALTESLRYELQPWGIQASVVCPAFVRTGLAASLTGSDPIASAAAQALLRDAPVDARTVARRILEGIDRGEAVITPDAEGRKALFAKQWLGPLYARELRRRARDLFRAETEGRPLPPG